MIIVYKINNNEILLNFNSTYLILWHVLFCLYNLRTAALRLIVLSWIDVPTFATRRLHALPRESTQRRKVELCTRNVRKFCLNADFHVTFRDLLHGTDGLTSPPKEDVLRIFFRPKNPTASAGCEPANLGTKGQHATSRPPKPLDFMPYLYNFL